MTDITELAQREKFEAWFKSSFHPDKTGPYIKDQLYFAWKAASAELVEALESEKRICATWRKTAEANSEKLEKAQGMEAYWKTQCRGITDHCEELQARIAELESRTVKLPDDEDGQAYGFGKWANGKLPATAGTMTIAYCEDAWRAAFEVFSSAAGIKVEAE